MNAFLEWDPEQYKKVKQKHLDAGWDEKDFEALVFYKPSYLRRRVARVALPPRQLYYRVRAVYVTFGKKSIVRQKCHCSTKRLGARQIVCCRRSSVDFILTLQESTSTHMSWVKMATSEPTGLGFLCLDAAVAQIW
jgi:hypothetical protein